MMVSGAHVLGLIVGGMILFPRRRPTHGYLFFDAGRPGGSGVWKTGINTAGILTSINGFLGKVAMACGPITGVLLSSSGYIANHTQSDSALLAIKACYLYIPALILASMLWMGRFYRLDDQYEQIRARSLRCRTRRLASPAPTAGESPAM